MRFCRWLGRARFGNVFSATLMGFTCTFLLGRAGEPIRPVLIATKDSLSMPQMFGIYVLERVFDIAATAVTVILALLLFRSERSIGRAHDLLVASSRSAGVALLVGLLALIGFLVYFRYHGAEWLAMRMQESSWRGGWRRKIFALLQGFSEGLRGVRTWRDLIAASGYTALHWALVVLVYYWLIRAFPGTLSTLSVASVVLVAALTLVGSMVQLPGVGGGSQAATFLVLTSVFGVQDEPAVAASIVIWLVTFAGCCIVGLPLLFREGWSMGELRRLAVEEERVSRSQLLAGAERGSAPEERPE